MSIEPIWYWLVASQYNKRATNVVINTQDQALPTLQQALRSQFTYTVLVQAFPLEISLPWTSELPCFPPCINGQASQEPTKLFFSSQSSDFRSYRTTRGQQQQQQGPLALMTKQAVIYNFKTSVFYDFHLPRSSPGSGSIIIVRFVLCFSSPRPETTFSSFLSPQIRLRPFKSIARYQPFYLLASASYRIKLQSPRVF